MLAWLPLVLFVAWRASVQYGHVQYAHVVGDLSQSTEYYVQIVFVVICHPAYTCGVLFYYGTVCLPGPTGDERMSNTPAYWEPVRKVEVKEHAPGTVYSISFIINNGISLY